MNRSETKAQRVVIVGGGAGGLILATRLGRLAKKTDYKSMQVTLIDHSSTHIWKPLLHEIAAGTLNSYEDEISFFTHGQKNGYNFILGNVSSVEKKENLVIVDELTSSRDELIRPEIAVPFDTLVIAAGSVSNDFGIDGVSEHCYLLDSRSEAERLHQRISNQLTALQYDPNTAQHEPFVISVIGGGATGVELATEIAAVIEHMEQFKTLRSALQNIKIRIIEAGETLLDGQDAENVEVANDAAKKDQIEILTNSRVSAVSVDKITLSDGSELDSNIHIWTTGVKAPKFVSAIEDVETNRIGQIVVDKFLAIPNFSNAYVIGDCAEAKSGGERLGPRAQVAQEEAIYLFESIKKRLQGLDVPPFEFKEKGSVFSLGEDIATGTLRIGGKNSIHIKGRVAKLAYDMLYRRHQVEVLGWFRGLMSIAMSGFSRVVGSKVKLH